jgi:uncharacterized glyoxalase superfamily protein PhnB
MTTPSGTGSATVVPTLRYRDGRAAIDFLCKAFGFQEHLVVPDPSGGVAHAQLVFGNGMVMLGSARNNEFHDLVQSPAESGAIGSQSAYVFVSDVDAHYQRAKAAGAAMVIDIADNDYGGRGYSCKDVEGHVWNFGSYDPWTVPTEPAG